MRVNTRNSTILLKFLKVLVTILSQTLLGVAIFKVLLVILIDQSN